MDDFISHKSLTSLKIEFLFVHTEMNSEANKIQNVFTQTKTFLPCFMKQLKVCEFLSLHLYEKQSQTLKQKQIKAKVENLFTISRLILLPFRRQQ
jgi:hypothetical protein